MFGSIGRWTNPEMRHLVRATLVARCHDSGFRSVLGSAGAEPALISTAANGAKSAFARGYRPPFSELYLRNQGRRSMHFRAGLDCPPGVTKASAELFDLEHDGMLRDGRLDKLDEFIDFVSKSGHELRAYDD